MCSPRSQVAFGRDDFAGYIGYTCQKLEKEQSRWGAKQTNPIVSELDGSNIKEEDFDGRLRFCGTILNEDRYRPCLNPSPGA